MLNRKVKEVSRVKSRVYRQLITKLTLLVLFFIGVIPGFAVVIDSSNVRGVWTADNNPYQIATNIVLATDDSLLIEPGVKVEFLGPFKFEVHGLLEAFGTRDEWIEFTAQDSILSDSLWKGIRFVDAQRGCVLSFCRIKHSWARGEWPENNGGGIYIKTSTVTIDNCEIAHNQAESDGGGLFGWFTQSVIQNCVFAHNRSGNDGGGLYFAYANPYLYNLTVANNFAFRWGGGIYAGADVQLTLWNSIVNLNEQDSDIGGDFSYNLGGANSALVAVGFCSIRELVEYDPFPGPGNITGNPRFLNETAENYNYHLDFASSCIDAGDPGWASGQESDPKINLGAYGGTSVATQSVPVFWNRLINSDPARALNFNDLKINLTKSSELTIENRGHSELYISDLVFSSDAFYPDSAVVDGVLQPSYSVAPIEPGEVIKIIISFTPTEIRDYNDTITFITNDTIATENPPILIAVGNGINPVAEIIPEVDFDTTAIGAKPIITEYLYNNGQSPLTVTVGTSGRPQIQGDGFVVNIPGMDPNNRERDVPPGGRLAINITFLPLVPSEYDAVVTIRTNDENKLVNLKGVGAGPSLETLIDTLFLGYVYFDGDSSVYQVPVTNTGNDTLVIDDLILTNSANFRAYVPDGGYRVAPRDTIDFNVIFDPVRADRLFEGYLFISSNYPKLDTVEVSGEGMPEPGKYVFGEVNGVWERSNLDYIVLDSVIVPHYTSLKVMPGVNILFEPGAMLRADGELRALGQPGVGDSIYFLPRETTGLDGDRWRGIEIGYEDGSKLNYCFIQGSTEGLSIKESSPLIQFSTITDNGIETTSEINGGGIFIENSGVRINGCDIHHNIGRNGGGIYAVNSKPRITNCQIRDNQASFGGGIYLHFQSSAWIQSNLIFNNTADSCGGIAVLDQSSPWIVNNTIADNSNGGIFSRIRSIPKVTNCVVWNNEDEQISVGTNSPVLISYSDIQGGFSGPENIEGDPLFIDDLYHVDEVNSPLIDAGDPLASYRDFFVPPSLGTAINDIGAYGGPLGGGWETPEMTISVFQNPAFPSWMDIFVTVNEETVEIPICSLTVAENTPALVILSQTQENSGSYHGSAEANESGTVFLTVNAEVSAYDTIKVGRTFELAFVEPITGGTIDFVNIDGHLELHPGSFDNLLHVLTGINLEPLKPTEKVLTISPEFYINGLGYNIYPEAELALKFDYEDQPDQFLNGLFIYRISKTGYEKLEGGYSDGYVRAQISNGGHFVLGWEKTDQFDQRGTLPSSLELIKAYPNPFNQNVNLEFSIVKKGFIQFGIYDLNGRLVNRLLQTELNAGKHYTVWNGRDNNGKQMSSGIYWAHLNGVGHESSIKLLLLR